MGDGDPQNLSIAFSQPAEFHRTQPSSWSIDMLCMKMLVM